MRYGKLLAPVALWLSLGSAPAVTAPPGEWRNAPDYVRLFAPAGPYAASYRAYVSARDLASLLRSLDGDSSLLRPPGSWTPAFVVPSDAFGQAGGYDRTRLARLYGARRALVARGPRGENGRPTEAWTLISPYPDVKLERLNPGTLLMVLYLDPANP